LLPVVLELVGSYHQNIINTYKDFAFAISQFDGFIFSHIGKKPYVETCPEGTVIVPLLFS
jgi:hypothetical protein